MAKHHSRPLYYFSSPPGFSDFSSSQFSGGVTGSHHTPQGSEGSPSYLQRNPRVDSEESYRPNRRFSVTLPFSFFCDFQENRGSSSNIESEENQCDHFGTTFLNGNTHCHSTESAPSRLGSLDRFEGCLPARAGTPSVQETAGFQIPRQDLHVQGLAFRPKRLSVGLFENSSYGNSSPSPAGHPDILLSGRLAAGRRVPVAPPVPPSSHSSVGPELGFIINLKKSVLTSQRMPVYLGASLDIPRFITRPVERRVGALQSLIQELTASLAAPALLWQRLLGHLASFVDLVPNCRLLMLPLQLHFLRFFSPLLDSQSKLIPLTQEIKVQCAAWASPVRLLEGKPFSPPPPPPPIPSSDLRSLPVRLGRDSPASPGFRHLVPGGVRGPYQLSRAQGSVSGPEVSRGSCFRSVSSGSFGQHNSRVLFQLPGRNSLPLSLPSGIRALGVVYSEGNSPFGRSLSGGGQLGSRLPIQREVSPIRMESESLDFSVDLSGSSPSSGDRPIRVHPQFSTSKYCARCRDPQAWKVDAFSFRWSGLPLYAFPPFSILPTVLEKIAQEGADMALVAPFWPQRPWFLKLLSLLAGQPRVLPLQMDLVYEPMSRQPHPRLESLHLTLSPLSGRKESRLAFLLELQSSQQKLLGSQHKLLTIPSWNVFSSGVTSSLVTPILPL